MSDMSDSSNIESGLSTHDLGSIWGEFWDIFVVLRFEFFVLIVEFLYFLFGKSSDVIHEYYLRL